MKKKCKKKNIFSEAVGGVVGILFVDVLLTYIYKLIIHVVVVGVGASSRRR